MWRNYLRQLYKVASEIPSCFAKALIVGGLGDNILLSTASLRALGMRD
ncbi:MAG: hypothetical protein JWM42_172, partial [Burkholderia sp.]|nr:hypothetical protein [Burkholderia sp.]